jgi:enoyl-CoA hydratase
MSDPELIAHRDGALGRLTLNRPSALGALTTGMCEAMTAALLGWRDDPTLHSVMIDHAGPRGFCAGGDIRFLADSGAAGGAGAFNFFAIEYRLNQLLGVYPKPLITVMDGVTMGGGVGISWPAQVRIATERTRFAMPETGIGLFPDVGSGWYLPRLAGRAGLWLVLTGARLGPADCRALGLATHVVESADLPAIKAKLAADPAAIRTILAEFEPVAGPASISDYRADIDRLFTGDSVEAILASLQADGSEWALAQAEAMAPKCPVSAKVAFRLIAGGLAPKSLADDLVIEYRLGRRIVVSADFAEGVRAVIVDKDNRPAWLPASLAEVTEAMVDAIFAPLPAGEEWTPLLAQGD